MSTEAENNPLVTPIKLPQYRSSRQVAKDMGISRVTMWRWVRQGWIKEINISGKPYVDMNSLAEFERRAAAGEFSKSPVGAAWNSLRAGKLKRAMELRHAKSSRR